MRLSIAGAILTLGLLSAPLGADAQPAGKVRRVALRRGGMRGDGDGAGFGPGYAHYISSRNGTSVTS
jgi:hypothetical protein